MEVAEISAKRRKAAGLPRRPGGAAVAGGYGEVTGCRRGRVVFGSKIPAERAFDHEPAVGIAPVPAVRTRATPRAAWYWRSAWQCIVSAFLVLVAVWCLVPGRRITRS
jgi:hypothetical protein